MISNQLVEEGWHTNTIAIGPTLKNTFFLAKKSKNKTLKNTKLSNDRIVGCKRTTSYPRTSGFNS